MTRKEKPLAKAGQAGRQGASNNYQQDTHSSTVGQGQQSSLNSAATQRKEVLSLQQSAVIRDGHSPIIGKKFRSKYHACRSASICFVRGFRILRGRKFCISLGEVRA